jgi:hypothetical protein
MISEWIITITPRIKKGVRGGGVAVKSPKPNVVYVDAPLRDQTYVFHNSNINESASSLPNVLSNKCVDSGFLITV